MKIMGLSNWLHWVAWFVKSFLILFISVVLMTILFVVKTEENALVNAADTSVIFVFLLLYAVSCICFSFMISTFFKKGALSSEIFISSRIVYHNAYAWQLGDYRQVSNIRRAKFQHLKRFSYCLCQIPWSQMSSREWRCSWSSADRRCSNYIWVIDNFIAYLCASYIRGFTVFFSPVMWLSLCDSFQDRAPVDEIYGCPIFKWEAATWLPERVPGWLYLLGPSGWHVVENFVS